ncbi:MAG: isoleucine--tRNA ligase [Vicinamibacterales bacterium]
MTETTGINYKKTLNLPKTSFPMRAGLTTNEPLSRARWERLDLYNRILTAREDATPFVFHDGPPYASGPLHVGHLLNRVLKDFVVRSRLMSEHRCAFHPGWDCHGLPIEHKVMTELVESGEVGDLNTMAEGERRMAIRRRCADYAHQYVGLQAEHMKQLMTLADFENPYLTLTPDYEAAVLEVFACLVEKGLVYRALKSVHWSIENQTALADAELEYHDREDTAVFVDFEAVDAAAVAKVFGVELDQTPSFMIWTTTPWTLPANLAIAVHERFQYTLVRIDGNVTVIATDLVEPVTKAANTESVEVLGTTSGKSLVGLTYRQPLNDRVCPIVKADYVTLVDGTGLVHTAPGHGTDDNLTAIREGLDVYCPVLGDGTYDQTVPGWLVGMSIWEANPRIVEHLREQGNLYHDHKIKHSYPHDWRGKSPVIFRATEQWFIGVDRPATDDGRSLRELARAAIETDIRFVPEWGRNRMNGMLETRPDWCLSRQRAWGLPIPAFTCPDGEVLLTPASVRAVAAVFGARGSDAWFTESAESLLAGYDAANDPDAPANVRDNGVSGLTQMFDIFDVWFESGSSWNAAMRSKGRGYPIDLYLEGSDQHRGWFQLSLLPSLGVTGQPAFRTLVTHGFTVDKHGRKMSKADGNAINLDEVLAKYGVDVCRWWVSSLPYENDVKMDITFFDLAGDTYRKVRNTLRFLLSNLADFSPQPPKAGTAAGTGAGTAPPTLDAWVLGRTASVHEQVLAAFEGYAFKKANQLLYDFCNDSLSALYCAAVKDRLYCDAPGSQRRRVTQAVMWEVAETLCRLLAPLLPHTADEAYRALLSPSGDDQTPDETTVHLQTFGAPSVVEVDAAWPKVMQLRDTVLKALEDAKAQGVENPLDAEVVLADPDGILAPFEPELADLFGVSRVQLVGEGDIVTINNLSAAPRCDRCWRRVEGCVIRDDGGMLCDRCGEVVSCQ